MRIRGLVSPDIAGRKPGGTKVATLVVRGASLGRDDSDGWAARLQSDGVRGASVVLQSCGIEGGIGVLLVDGHSGKITIGATLQVEPQAGHLATPILALAVPRCVVGHDGCTHVERANSGQAPSYVSSIISDGTVAYGHLAEVVVKAASPGQCRIAGEGAQADGHLTALIKEAAAMLG